MTTKLPTPRKANFSLGGLAAATQQIGAGGGGEGRYLSINHKTGEMTVGREKTPLDTSQLYAVLVQELRFGYYIFQGKNTPDKTNMVPMIAGKPKPVPSIPYTQYPDDGPRDMVEMQLHPTNEPGANPIEFAPTSVSSQNRINNLVQAVVMQEQLPAGQVGFTNPLIEVKSAFWTGDYGDIWHFDYKIHDWTDASGELRQSEWEQTAQVEDSSDQVIDEEEPFDPMG